MKRASKFGRAGLGATAKFGRAGLGATAKFGRAAGRGRTAIVVATGALLGAGALAGCGGSSDTSTSATNAANTGGSGGSSTTLNLVAYSTPKKAYDALTAAYAQTSQGKGVGFNLSFGA